MDVLSVAVARPRLERRLSHALQGQFCWNYFTITMFNETNRNTFTDKNAQLIQVFLITKINLLYKFQVQLRKIKERHSGLNRFFFFFDFSVLFSL